MSVTRPPRGNAAKPQAVRDALGISEEKWVDLLEDAQNFVKESGHKDHVEQWKGLSTATREQLPIGLRDWSRLRHREYYLHASNNWLSKYLLVRWFKNRYDKHRSRSSVESISHEASTRAAEAEPGPCAADAEHAMKLEYVLNKEEEEADVAASDDQA